MRKRIALLACCVIVAGCGTHDRTQELHHQKLTVDLVKAQKEQGNAEKEQGNAQKERRHEPLAAVTQEENERHALEKKYKAVAAAQTAGLSAAGRGDFDGALAAFTKLIQLDPNRSYAFFLRAWAYYNRAIVHRDKHNVGEALPDIAEAIRLDPHRLDPKASEVFVLRGSIYFYQGHPRRAVADFTQALQGNLEPRRREKTLCLRGFSLLDQKEFDKAIADFSDAIRLDSLDDEAFYRRGVAYAARARRDCKDSDDPKAYQGNKDIKNAIADFREVVRLCPSRKDAAEMLMLALELTAPPDTKKPGKP